MHYYIIVGFSYSFRAFYNLESLMFMPSRVISNQRRLVVFAGSCTSSACSKTHAYTSVQTLSPVI